MVQQIDLAILENKNEKPVQLHEIEYQLEENNAQNIVKDVLSDRLQDPQDHQANILLSQQNEQEVGEPPVEIKLSSNSSSSSDSDKSINNSFEEEDFKEDIRKPSVKRQKPQQKEHLNGI